MEPVQKFFLTQGILGFIVIALAGVVIYLFRRYDKREEWWQGRYDTLMERHNITTEKYANKGIEAGEALALIAANVRRRGGGGGGSGGV